MTTASFERLHPALQFHIVNSLGWNSLRPTQQQAIEPILDGAHCLILAPTAGGKTEAAMIPVLSRMANEQWRGPSVLYVCPIKALLNNLESRLASYAAFVGRSVAVWHGDVGGSRKTRALREAPDVLLTTPESLEAMLISTRIERARWFGQIRIVIVDELHAFAGDDRGWHLRAVLARIQRYAQQPVQRIGLSATLGNPDELLDWFAPQGRRCVVGSSKISTDADVTIDHVGSLQNAATVIHRLHQGSKRLVFCDSRAKVESLAALLRTLGTRTFISHASLSLAERRLAEQAFAEEPDCVIVATSTLELGIDVGDLDYVLQIDAPSSVSSFLQRMGRSGRRAGTRRNFLFLCTSDESLLVALGICQLWSEGHVENVQAPGQPWHIVAQQAMALTLERAPIPRVEMIATLRSLFTVADADAVQRLLGFMVDAGILFEDPAGLAMGVQGEALFGRSNFLDLLSSFTSALLLSARYGSNELGFVDPLALPTGDSPHDLLLGGRSWRVVSVDWPRRMLWVEPSQRQGKARWSGAARGLGYELCQGVRRSLASEDPPHALTLSRRAATALAELREALPEAARQGRAAIQRLPNGRARWWTFAGAKANAALLAALHGGTAKPRADDFVVDLADAAETTNVRLPDGHAAMSLHAAVLGDAIDSLKFRQCLPLALAREVVQARCFDLAGARRVLEMTTDRTAA